MSFSIYFSSKLKKKTLHPRYKLRSLFRRVTENLQWISDTSHLRTTGKAAVDEYIEKHTLGTHLFTITERFILFRTPEDRTCNELEILKSKLEDFKAFRTFSDEVQYKMLRRAQFLALREGVTVIKQGKDTFNAYFIIHGSVEKCKQYTNPIIPTEVVEEIQVLKFGDIFGDAAILYDEMRDSTFTTTRNVELMYLQKDDFKEVLEESVIKRRARIRDALSNFEVFHKFTELDIRSLCDRCELEHYPINEIIKKKNYKGEKLSYFMLSGRCAVMERLLIKINQCEKGAGKYSLFFDQRIRTPYPEDVECVFMQTCLLKPNCFFGIGEKMAKRIILTLAETKFLVVARSVLFEFNIANLWSKSIIFMNNLYPSYAKILEEFIIGREMSTFKDNGVLTSDLWKKNPSGTIVHDAPLGLRSRELRLSRPLYKNIINLSKYQKTVFSMATAEEDIETPTMPEGTGNIYWQDDVLKAVLSDGDDSDEEQTEPICKDT